MRLLIDTHIYLWWLVDSPRLSSDVVEALAEPSTVVHVSAASIWEASIKSSLGRLDIDGIDLTSEVALNGFSDLAVSATHGWVAGMLPPHHLDPFDRVLVAQARAEQLILVTDDPVLADYDVELFAG